MSDLTSGLILMARGLRSVAQPARIRLTRRVMEKKSRVYDRKLSPCSKLRLLLTATEAEQLDDSTAQSGAGSRAFLVAEAIRAGLANPNQTLSPGKRDNRVDAWVPKGLLAGLKSLAATHHLPQQHLLRLFLFQYLATAPWERDQKEKATESLVQ